VDDDYTPWEPSPIDDGPVPGPTPIPDYNDRTDPDRVEHDYEEEKVEHSYDVPDADPGFFTTWTWIWLGIVALLIIVVGTIAYKCVRKQKSDRETRRESFHMQYNSHDTDGTDSDEEEEVRPVKKSKKKKSAHAHKTDYSQGIESDRVRKALMLAVNSRKE